MIVGNVRILWKITRLWPLFHYRGYCSVSDNGRWNYIILLSGQNYVHVHFILNMQVTDFKPTKLSLLTLLIASMLILMGGAAVAPALPEIGMVFPQYDSFLINLIISPPSLAIVLAGLVIGALADRLGKVRVLLVSLALFGVAGVSGYSSTTSPRSWSGGSSSEWVSQEYHAAVPHSSRSTIPVRNA